MAGTRIEVKPESTLVEVRFASSPSFSVIEQVLGQLRNYIADGYQVKLFGYIKIGSVIISERSC